MKKVFIIMPFSSTTSCTTEQWDEIFFEVFKPAVESIYGYECLRAKPSTGNLIKSIIEDLYTSHLVIADLTDNNPNVFYELGVRHTLSKRTILVTQKHEFIPSDLRGYWSIIYGLRPKQVSSFKVSLKEIILSIEKDPEKSDNPITDFLENENYSINLNNNEINRKKLSALYTEMSGIQVYFIMLKDAPSTVFKTPVEVPLECINLYLTTFYIDFGAEITKSLFELRNLIINFKHNTTHRKIRIINSIIHINDNLMSKIKNIEFQISRGTYKEPATPSLMIWQAMPGNNINHMDYERIEPLNNNFYCNLYETPNQSINTNDNNLALNLYQINIDFFYSTIRNLYENKLFDQIIQIENMGISDKMKEIIREFKDKRNS